MELTAAHMNIPAAAAREAWRICAPTCRALGLEIDELEQVAALALWKAVLCYDPTRSHDVPEGFGVYLCQRAKWGIMVELKRRNSPIRRPQGSGLVSLDAALDDGGELTGAALVSRDDHSRHGWEAEEAVGEVMRWLLPADREAVRMCYLDGLTQAEAAERLGLCPQAVGKRLEQARRRLRGMRRFRHLTQGGEAA